MKKIKVNLIGLTLLLLGCSTKQTNSQNYLSESVIQSNSPLTPAPDIGIDPKRAFFPLRVDISDGKIKPSFQTRVCVKKFVICLKWEKRTLYFDQLDWFYEQDFVLQRLPEIK